MKKKLLRTFAAVIAIFVFGHWWLDRDWQTHECTGYVVGKSRGANGTRKAIASWNAMLGTVARPLFEDEYGFEIQARIGDMCAPIQMFDVDRAEYEAIKCGARVTIRYREHQRTHERITLVVIPLHEWWDSYAK